MVFLLVVTVFASPFVTNGYSTVWKAGRPEPLSDHYVLHRRYVVEAASTFLATHQLVLPQWDFAIGQGASILSVFHINPLFLLAIVTPYRWMEVVYNVVTVAQIPLAAWRSQCTAAVWRNERCCRCSPVRSFTPAPGL